MKVKIPELPTMAEEIQMVIDECRRRGGQMASYGPGNIWTADRLEELQRLRKEVVGLRKYKKENEAHKENEAREV